MDEVIRESIVENDTDEEFPLADEGKELAEGTSEDKATGELPLDDMDKTLIEDDTAEEVPPDDVGIALVEVEPSSELVPLDTAKVALDEGNVEDDISADVPLCDFEVALVENVTDEGMVKVEGIEDAFVEDIIELAELEATEELSADDKMEDDTEEIWLEDAEMALGDVNGSLEELSLGVVERKPDASDIEEALGEDIEEPKSSRSDDVVIEPLDAKDDDGDEKELAIEIAELLLLEDGNKLDAELNELDKVIDGNSEDDLIEELALKDLETEASDSVGNGDDEDVSFEALGLEELEILRVKAEDGMAADVGLGDVILLDSTIEDERPLLLN